ncbi:MAG: tetratricopeptide repeat protein [Bryobacterales bacterium]|nr:tetratricopeptide repeat protein [Bryobacterales bacterium]
MRQETDSGIAVARFRLAMPLSRPAGRRRVSPELLLCLLLLVVAAAYANHFGNGFHFDDFHTVTDNAYVRSLGNLPRFFVDPGAFSTLPTHQVYRPVVSASLALDYWLAGGYHPWAFHASTFFWFCVLIVTIFLLFRRLTGGQAMTALGAAAVHALHPVSAETVNYVIQRADLYATLGAAAALLLYAALPEWRRSGLYLIPFVLGALSKPTALVFPLLLLLYLRLYERSSWRVTIGRCLPALAVTAALAALLSRMVATTFAPGGGERLAYWITQTWVTLEYLAAFFWPNRLSADSDARLLTGFPPQALAGVLVLASLAAVALWCARSAAWRPVAFGLGWFFIALLPTAAMPLAEVANDHRMFFPFVGLSLAVVSGLGVLARRFGKQVHRAAAVGVCLVLAVSAYATHRRNEVWRSEESLWRDVTEKSPSNGRGWMNYALTQMGKGDYANALIHFERASQLSPNYPLLEVNLAIAKAGLGRHAEAEPHFRRALSLAPAHAGSHFYYGRWLLQQERNAEAVERLEAALRINPTDLAARSLLMQTHYAQQNWSKLRPLAEASIELDRSSGVGTWYLDRLRELDEEIARAAGSAKSADDHLALSLLYYRAGRFEDSIETARRALRQRPDYAAAYNNLAAGLNALERWDEGIAAAREAVRLDPTNQLARNNLAWAMSQKGKTQP